MVRKKILPLILMVGIVGGMGIYGLNYYISSKQNIEVMAYKPSAKTNEKGFQIDKYSSIETIAWLSDNKVLTLTKKGDFKNPDSTVPIRYCSIYNLNTKTSKDFKDVNIDEFMGVSPDKKYVLYAEAIFIPKIGSSQWINSEYYGDVYNENVKLLNLSTGEITNVNTEKLTNDAEIIWVSNNKILINYDVKWKIIDTTGKVYANGSYNDDEFYHAKIYGVDDIKDLGTSVEGKFYCTQTEPRVKLYTVDVVTKKIKTIFSEKNSLGMNKRGNTIVIDHFNYNSEQASKILFLNTTFVAIIMDESGKQLQYINLPKCIGNKDYALSPDGSKVAYVEFTNDISTTPYLSHDPDQCLKIIDAKTGAVKEIVNTSTLKDKDAKNDYTILKLPDKDGNVTEKKIPVTVSISNICWDDTSSALSFTYGDSRTGNVKIDTYIVSLDK